MCLCPIVHLRLSLKCECINHETPFTEKPGQSILQPDSDELPHFSQFANFMGFSRTKFGLHRWFTTILFPDGVTLRRASLCIKCISSKIGCWAPLLANFVRRFNRSGVTKVLALSWVLERYFVSFCCYCLLHWRAALSLSLFVILFEDSIDRRWPSCYLCPKYWRDTLFLFTVC